MVAITTTYTRQGLTLCFSGTLSSSNFKKYTGLNVILDAEGGEAEFENIKANISAMVQIGKFS